MPQYQVNADSNPSNVIAYVPRYCEYKSRPDEIHSTFQSNGINKTWTTSRTFQYKLGAFYTGLKVSPHVTDSLFTAIYNGTKLTDPYQCYYAFYRDWETDRKSVV